jgi:putative chitinase
MKLISKNELKTFFSTQLLASYGLLDPKNFAMFLAQITHESACLTQMVESFNYDPLGLYRTFGKIFTKEQGQELGRTPNHPANQEMIANIAYADKIGNGDVDSGDGWLFKGRGPLQLTGRDNYTKCAQDTGIDCLNNPNILCNLSEGCVSALWFWKVNKINDAGNDIENVTRIINKACLGINERRDLYFAYLKLLTNK